MYHSASFLRLFAAAALLGLSVVPGRATAEASRADSVAASTAPVYSVDAYDPARDPAEDLAKTIAQATAKQRRILLEVGGEWCSWCHALDRYVHETASVAEALSAGFLIMKVNYSEENENTAFLSDYPEILGYPHIFVLEHDGTFLHSQNTGDLEQDRSYSEEAMLAFLMTWAPEAEMPPEVSK